MRVKRLQKDKGNTTILVLILALVIIMGTASMVSFVFRDIRFTKIDEGNLRALNFAEAGIADFQHRITNYLAGQAEAPSEQYQVAINGPDGESEGSFAVSHEAVYEGDTLQGYVVISQGTDKSDWQRTVRVYFLLGGSIELDIYEFIYSANSMNYGDLQASGTTISGPFFTNQNLNLRGNVSFLEGPLYVGENIKLGGSASLGSSDQPIDLYLGGIIEGLDGNEIDPDDPDHNEDVYVANYSSEVPLLPMVEIDETYKSDLTDHNRITGDLIIENTKLTGDNIDDDYLSISQDGGNYILDISGNIIVEGQIRFKSDTNPSSPIYYRGKGILLSESDIIIDADIIPYDADISGPFPYPAPSFPNESLMVLLSETDIRTASNNLEFYCLAIANKEIMLSIGSNVLGSLIAQHLIVNNESSIYYESDLVSALQDLSEIPQSSIYLPDSVFLENWQEIPNQS